MSRKYGLTLWTFGNISFEEKCRIAKDIGVDGVEIEGDLSYEPEDIKKILRKYDLELYSITPENVDIYSPDLKIRIGAIDYYLELIEWAKSVGSPRFCLHGEVGEIEGSGHLERDWNNLIDSTKTITQKAAQAGLEVVFEVLNRYESSMIRNVFEAIELIERVDSDNLKILLDSYHMNIEEKAPEKSIVSAGDNLGIYHIADSNREGVGNGHANLKEQINSLNKIGYKNPIIMEMTAAGPNPFTPIKNSNSIDVVSEYYRESLLKLKEWDV